MNRRLSPLIMAVSMMLLVVSPSEGGPPNPTASDASGNTAGGTGALLNVLSSSFSNTVFGRSALEANTSGLFNTAFGRNALDTNTTGNSNTACGALALDSNTTGAGNTASGVNTLLSSTTGVRNTALGLNALRANTTGHDNTALGGARYSPSKRALAIPPLAGARARTCRTVIKISMSDIQAQRANRARCVWAAISKRAPS